MLVRWTLLSSNPISFLRKMNWLKYMQLIWRPKFWHSILYIWAQSKHAKISNLEDDQLSFHPSDETIAYPFEHYWGYNWENWNCVNKASYLPPPVAGNVQVCMAILFLGMDVPIISRFHSTRLYREEESIFQFGPGMQLWTWPLFLKLFLPNLVHKGRYQVAIFHLSAQESFFCIIMRLAFLHLS